MRQVVLDQYFTKGEDAKKFVEVLNRLYPLKDYDFVLEPSAGGGSFYFQLPPNRIGIDLEPLSSEIQRADFFQWQPPEGRGIVVGNPPFGRRGSLARRFFEKAASFSDVVAFILPAIFSKPSFHSGLNPHFHLEYEEFVDEFFLPDGSTKKINCVFQIWKKKDFKREKLLEPKEHKDFLLIHRHISRTSPEELLSLENDYDFAYGQISGKINNIRDVKKGSQFFVKDVSAHKKVKSIFEKMDWEVLKKYSMGPLSLGRGDIIKQYQYILESLCLPHITS